MVGGKAFLAKPKYQSYVSQCGRHDSSAQTHKEWGLLWESKFNSFDGETLIIRKIVGRKAFFAKSKHQYRASKWGEHDYSAHDKRNGDYYDYPSLSHLMDNHW